MGASQGEPPLSLRGSRSWEGPELPDHVLCFSLYPRVPFPGCPAGLQLQAELSPWLGRPALRIPALFLKRAAVTEPRQTARTGPRRDHSPDWPDPSVWSPSGMHREAPARFTELPPSSHRELLAGTVREVEGKQRAGYVRTSICV